MSLAEIARESGLHKSVCHRLLVTMADEGAIDQVASDGKYRIGVGPVSYTHLTLPTERIV